MKIHKKQRREGKRSGGLNVYGFVRQVSAQVLYEGKGKVAGKKRVKYTTKAKLTSGSVLRQFYPVFLLSRLRGTYIKTN